MDAFFANKKEFFSRLKEQQLENYNRKLQLCVEAEALADSKEWKKATDRIKKLQEEWKKIGPVPKRHSDKIWKRFRSACDAFFTSKSEHFSGIKGVEEENLRLKRELLERIKAYEIKAERSENMEAIKAFQREWMAIGYVPMKYKDATQDEYRKSIDALFDKMKFNENEISTAQYRNMVEGMKDDPESRDKVRRERNILTNKITKLREEISVLENNIGFFSGSKQSEIMRAEYEKKINRAKNDVKVLEAKLKILNEQ
jgi:polyhydroxyalkanoate synthesis regulator phasin